MGIRDVQAIDDIQDFLRESLVELPSGALDSQRDQLIDGLCKLDQQLAAQGTAMRWLVWIRYYGDQLDSELVYSIDALGQASNRISFSLAIEQWLGDVEDLLLESEGTAKRGGHAVCFSGALAMSTLREICGSWDVGA